jgi:hypothetical protein
MITEIKNLISRLIRKALGQVHTHLPAQVTAYDATTNLCSVQPCIKTMRVTDPKNLNSVNLPLLEDVPVQLLGSGKLLFSVTPKVGSYGVLHISERAIEKWIMEGGIQNPNSARRFDLSDAFFEPGIYPQKADGDNGLIESGLNEDRAEIRTRTGDTAIAVLDDETIEIKNASATITIATNGDVSITSDGKIVTNGSESVIQNGSDYAVQYTALKSAFDTLKTDFNNHVIWTTSHIHPGVLAGPASTGVAVPPPIQSAADMSGAKVTKVRLP